MIRHIKKYFAIRSYTMRLGGELARRFDVQHFYTVDQVTKAAERGHFNTGFIAYAHATFCSRKDFDAYYESLGVSCTYDGLRSVIARRYFGGSTEFDAAYVIRVFRRQDGYFYESGAGETGG